MLLLRGTNSVTVGGAEVAAVEEEAEEGSTTFVLALRKNRPKERGSAEGGAGIGGGIG